MINSNSITKFKESLANFIESGDNELLKWFIDLDKESKSNLLNSDIFLIKFWNAFVRNGLQNVDIFNYLAASSSHDSRNQIGRLFSSLIETKQQNQYSTLLTLFIEKYSEWPVEIVKPIQNACISIALQIGAPHDVELFNAVLFTNYDISNEQLQQISTLMIPRLTNPDTKTRENALGLLKIINEKFDTGDSVIIKSCIENAKKLLDANDVNCRNLIDYVLSSPNKIPAKQIEHLIEIMKKNLLATKPPQILLLLLDYVPKIIMELNRHEVLYATLDLAKTSQDDNVKNKCFDILRSNKKLLNFKDEEKITKVFGEDFFEPKPNSSKS